MASLEPPEIAGSTERRFRVCPKCRLLTPAQLPNCVECGFRSFDTVAVERESHFIREFFARPTPFTYIIFGVNLLVFFLMIFCGGTANIETLRAFGAKENTLILKGEYWRFVTPIFIHIGLIHIGFNSYALVALGPAVEKLYGSARFVVIYMFAGILGVVGSFVWSMAMGRPGLAAGASGAIFGLFGVLGVFGFKYRSELPESFRRAFGGRILMTIAINLYIGFALPGIDNAAHIGGLVAGALAALLIPYQPVGAPRRGSIWTILQLGSLALILLSFLEVGLHYDGPSFSFNDLSIGKALGFHIDQDVGEFITAWNAGESAFLDSYEALFNASRTGEKLDEEKVLGIIENGLIGLGRAPRLDKKADEYRSQLKQLVVGNKALLERYREGKLSGEELKAQKNEFDRLTQNFCGWVKTDGRNYGITCSPKQTE